MKFAVEFVGLKETIAALAEFKSLVMPEVQKELDLSAEPLKYLLQEYPPPIPTSNYVRTYEYQRSVDVRTQLEGSTVELVETANYEQHWIRGEVDGSYSGAWMHRGRWRTMRDLIEQFVPVFLSHVQDRLEQLIGRFFR